MSWHAGSDALRDYADAMLDDVRACSLEAHLLSCDRCRAEFAGLGDPAELEQMWRGVVDRLDTPMPGPVERGLVALGVRAHVARLLAATPSLRASWLAAEALVLGLAALAVDWSSGPREAAAQALFLMVAAVLPVFGVAAAFGPRVDPTHEIALAAPIGSFRLLMIRTVAVLGASAAIAGLAAAALPDLSWLSVAWILPSLGLSLAALALSTFVRPLTAAVVVVGAWSLIAVSVTARAADRLAAFRAPAQLWFLLLMAVATALLAARRGAFEEEGGS